MANRFTNFLGNVVQGFGQSGNLKDHAHASKLYTPNNYGFVPKATWLYYVIFNINSSISPRLVDKSWYEKNRRNINLLVKKVDLPKFKLHTETLNQYNRQTVIQTKITYEPIKIVFHDDMSNITTDLWKNYYQYYYSDGSDITKPIFSNNKYEITELGKQLYGYNTFGDKPEPFFNSIEIYQLNRQQFTKFTIINPLITIWSHGTHDQTSESQLMENSMDISYETVLYDTDLKKNRITKSNPGFAEKYYDRSPSPISIGGNGSNTLLGIGGFIPGVNEVFGDIANAKSPLDIVNIGVKGRNLIRNVEKIDRGTLREEGLSVLGSVFRDSTRADAIASQTAEAVRNIGGVTSQVVSGIANSINSPAGISIPGVDAVADLLQSTNSALQPIAATNPPTQ